jgi:hypothetical protein
MDSYCEKLKITRKFFVKKSVFSKLYRINKRWPNEQHFDEVCSFMDEIGGLNDYDLRR